MNRKEQKSKSMPFSRKMSDALDRWLDNGGVIGEKINFSASGKAKDAGDNQSVLNRLIIAKGE